MLEKEIEKKLKTRVEALGCLCLKFESPGFTGVPDRIILAPGGGVAFAETKAPGRRERPRQLYVHELFRRLGHTVFPTVDNDGGIEEVCAWCRRQVQQ